MADSRLRFRYTSGMLRPLALASLALLLAAGCAHGAPNAPDFTLTDQRGAAWSLSAQRGKVVTLFFGYTHCLDTCPATLAKLASAIELQKSQSGAEIAFVTVDPQRDTPSALAAYVARFTGAPIVGLTGTQAQITSVEQSFHVWAQRIPGRRGNDNYDDAHTAIVFVIDRSGRIASMHDDADTVGAIAADLQRVLQ
jgi:protein SCO1/2